MPANAEDRNLNRTQAPVKVKRPIDSIESRPMDSLKAFHDVARALTSNLELEPLLRAILSKMGQFFGPEQWSLLMLAEEADELYYALSSGIEEDTLRDVRVPAGRGIAGYVAATGKPLVIPNVRTDADWSKFAAEHPELHLKSIVCLPLRFGDKTLGVLQLHNSDLDALPDESLSFLRVLCDYAAIALQNARQLKLVHHLSITDDCTGLFNARSLYEMLQEEITKNAGVRVRPIRRAFSLLFLDLDHFKTVNDTYGHLAGSRLLAEIGGLLKRCLGPEHAGFRYGGDEFVALLRGVNKKEATVLAADLRESLNRTRFLSGDRLSLPMTASFGLASFPEDGATLHDLIRAADAMMYKAKARGRNRLEVADPSDGPTEPAPKTSRHHL